MKVRILTWFLAVFVTVRAEDNQTIKVDDDKAIQIPHSSYIFENDGTNDQQENHPYKTSFNSSIPGLRAMRKEGEDKAMQTKQSIIDGEIDDFEIKDSRFNFPIGPEFDNLLRVFVINDDGSETLYNNASVYFSMETLDVRVTYGFPKFEPVPSLALDDENRQVEKVIQQKRGGIFARRSDPIGDFHLERQDNDVRNDTVLQRKQFVPLACNDKLDSIKCSSWVKKFGSASIQSTLIVIECGECYIMDFPGTTLTLKAGIDIVGKLVFPNGYRLRLVTSMIVVQGELEMTSTKPVDGKPDIEVTMIGMDEKFFTAQAENKYMCPKSRCLAGKKSITVAGGKLNGTFVYSGIVCALLILLIY
jgi:hypothetical protein